MRPDHANPLTAVLRTLGSLLPRGSRGRRTPGSSVVRPWRADSARGYPSVGLGPRQLTALLQAADGGTPQTQFELFTDMLQKWPRLAAVEATRRLALTGLSWEVVPPTNGGGVSGGVIEDAVAYCDEVLASLDRLDQVLDHLASAIGYGIAVAELVWERGRVVDIVPVPHTRLIGHPHEPWRLCVLTEDQPSNGVPLDEHPFKWLVHKPRATPGRHFDGGLLRRSTLLYLAQNLSFKDWLTYSQIAGMPLRVAQFEPGTPDADKDKLLHMLDQLGRDAVAVLSKNVDLRFMDAPGGGDRPYEPMQGYCNTEVTILWLGQHLTTDIKMSGSRAAAEVHDRVREDLLADDIADEGYTLRRDLLRPLVQARFGDDMPVPRFRRSLVQAVDTKVLADTLAVAVNELGLAVPQRWAHDALGIPQAEVSEATLTGGRS